VQQTAYETLRNEILNDLSRIGDADIVLIQGHGAMISESCDDCEGDILERIRAIVPDATIGMLLDPHCHVTDLMMSSSDLLICFKEYPHSDAAARASEMVMLATEAANGKIKPVMCDFDCRMVNLYLTSHPPMRRFVDAMCKAEENDGLLSLSLAHGFPWGDSPRTGTRMLAISDGDEDLATTWAEHFGKELIRQRHDVCESFLSIDDALSYIDQANDFPIVIADMADNPGGGAPSDATFLLHALLDHGLESVAAGIFFDPVTLRRCVAAGVGATLDIELGGRCGTVSGEPMKLTVSVRGHKESMLLPMGGGNTQMGEAVWLSAGNVDIIVNDRRTQCLHPDAFLKLGVPLDERRVILVKSTNHFFDNFLGLMAEALRVASPGALTCDFANIDYKKRHANYWPRVEDPWD